MSRKTAWYVADWCSKPGTDTRPPLVSVDGDASVSKERKQRATSPAINAAVPQDVLPVDLHLREDKCTAPMGSTADQAADDPQTGRLPQAGG